MSLLSRWRDTTTPTVTRGPEVPIPPLPDAPAKAGPETEQLIRALDSLRHTIETRSTTPIAVRITVVDSETGVAHDIPLTRKQAQRLTDVAAEFANDYHQARCGRLRGPSRAAPACSGGGVGRHPGVLIVTTSPMPLEQLVYMQT